MATKKAKQVAKLQIICLDNNECEVTIEGDERTLTASLASLMDWDDEENSFRQLMATAIQVVLFKDKLEKKENKKSTVAKKEDSY